MVGGFKYVYFHPYLGKIPILTHIFQMSWFNHQPDKCFFMFLKGKPIYESTLDSTCLSSSVLGYIYIFIYIYTRIFF